MRNERVRRNQQGFLLLDAMLALAFVAIALVAAGLFVLASRAAATTDEYARAANLAQEQLETLKLRPSGDWQTMTYPHEFPAETIVVGERTFTRKTVAVLRGDLGDGMAIVQITVAILWEDNGQARQSSYTTYYRCKP